jgi:drug/metabolite transporter (DMT)-like permease
LITLFIKGSLASRFRLFSLKYLVGCGSLFVFYSLLIYVAVGLAKDRQELLEVALINYLWPAGTILLSIPLLKQRANAMLVPGTAFAMAGVFLVMTQGASLSWHAFLTRLQSHPTSLLLAFVAAGAWALYSNLARRWAIPGGPGGVELFVPATGLVLLLARFFWPESGGWTVKAGVEAVTMGCITALAYVLWDAAMRQGNLLLVASFSYFTPLLSTIVSCVYLQVVPGSKLWIGSLLIVAGSLISWRSVAKSSPDRGES